MNESINSIEIVPFDKSLAIHFTRLNTQWLLRYFELEPLDHEMLGNPQLFFIEKGGFIFFARLNGTIVGTFALLKESDQVYELSKMAVDEAYQGKKIGHRMLEYAIQQAKALKALKIILYSNTMLIPALQLYKKFGFSSIPFNNPVFKRSNIKMELLIPVT